MLITEYIRSAFTQTPSNGSRACNPEQAARYFRSLAAREQGDSQIIGDATASDLDLNAVFGAIDRTESVVGQQYLYARLRLPHDEQDVARFIRETELFENDPALAARCAKQLERLAHNDAYDIQNLVFDTPEPVKHIRAIYALTATTLLSLAAAIVLHPLFLLLFLICFAVNVYLHYSNKLRITLYLSAVAQLRRCIRTARALASEPTVAATYDTSFLHDTASIERRSRVIGIQGGDGGDLTAAFWFLLELVKILFNEEIILFHRFIGTITTKREVIHRMFRFIGSIDAAISVGRLRAERPTCRPQFIRGKRFEARGMVHPLIADCVANSLTLDRQSLLLTGSNMSGKTTFVRTLCINSLTAQTLGFCFAESYTAPFLHIYTSIRIADDVEAGTSYYLAEVLTVREFLRAADGELPCLFALDELFKGTNTTERIAAGKAVLARLNRGDNLVCAATHDTELTQLLGNDYALCHFCEQVKDDRLVFDYRLHEGGLRTRNAIRILSLYDYPADVVADACATQEQLTRN